MKGKALACLLPSSFVKHEEARNDACFISTETLSGWRSFSPSTVPTKLWDLRTPYSHGYSHHEYTPNVSQPIQHHSPIPSRLVAINARLSCLPICEPASRARPFTKVAAKTSCNARVQPAITTSMKCRFVVGRHYLHTRDNPSPAISTSSAAVKYFASRRNIYVFLLEKDVARPSCDSVFLPHNQTLPTYETTSASSMLGTMYGCTSFLCIVLCSYA